MAEMTIDEEILIPAEQLPDLPGELCGIWAYLQWEDAGCPNRSAADSDNAYQLAIQVRMFTDPGSCLVWLYRRLLRCC